jgi:Icc-related predicted phosphoesterase
MKIALFSDSHGRHRQLEIPAAEILIFAGDLDNCRATSVAAEFNRFLGTLPHRYKIVIAGNHDHCLARDRQQAKELFSEAIYLQDEVVEVAGLKIYGAPWQPYFNERACDAFALPRGRRLREKWELIPAGIDILVTHTPPAGVLDLDGGVGHGCFDLAAAVTRVRPKYHVFGHVHTRYGTFRHGPTLSVNCNLQGEKGRLRQPLLLDYESGACLAGGEPRQLLAPVPGGAIKKPLPVMG